MINAKVNRSFVQPDLSTAEGSQALVKTTGKFRSVMQKVARRPGTMVAVGVVAVTAAASTAIMHSHRLHAPVPPLKPVANQPVAVVAATVAPVKHSILANPLRGIASWYGNVLHGHKTASGELFDETKMTACHNSLPFGTHVLVTDIRSRKSIVVRINDRGVLSHGRVIDLSSTAADRLGILRSGTAQVLVKVLPASNEYSD